MTETEKSLEPNNLELRAVMSAQRRFGFVALLWWIAAIFGTTGVIQEASIGRKIFVGISWVLAIFFSYCWAQVRKGRLSR
jgi:hypothetical protein